MQTRQQQVSNYKNKHTTLQPRVHLQMQNQFPAIGSADLLLH